MRQTRFLMGMPVIVEVVDPGVPEILFDQVYDYLGYVDRKFSTYKEDSEISRLNRGEIDLRDASDDLQGIFALAEATRIETGGYFEIRQGGRFDPSGIVKGWAILNAATILEEAGCENYYIYAGGDIQAHGVNPDGLPWQIGIQNPFKRDEIVKVVSLTGGGIATSGTYERGAHIYNPLDPSDPLDEIISLTVVGPNVYEADRFATAAFAMGRKGLRFIEEQPGLEGYMIDRTGMAAYTSGFDKVVMHA